MTKIMKSITIPVFTAFILMIGMSCEKQVDDMYFYDEESTTITEYLKAQEDTFELFYDILDESRLTQALNAYNPDGDNFTFFLPTNQAVQEFFSNSQYAGMEKLMADETYLKNLAKYHIVNSGINTNDFPYGSLPDTTATGDYLTIGFDSSVFKVNNEAAVIHPNIELSNGYIHVVDQVLKPIVFSSYEWLQKRDEFSIMTRLFEETGLADSMAVYSGNNRLNRYTLFAEPDQVFNEDSIYSLDDLKEKYSPNSTDYTQPYNGLYQFAAYHLIENVYFLDDFEGESTNYNTFTSKPIFISATGIDIEINPGVAHFDTLVNQGDTNFVDYVGVDYGRSNSLSKNGAIHVLNNVMDVYAPSRSERRFEFMNEPAISEARNQEMSLDIRTPNELEVIDWTGSDFLYYLYSSTPILSAWGDDYIELSGNFSISYQIPKLLPGKYELQIHAHGNSQNNAMVQVFLDGKRIGGNIDLTQGGNSTRPFNTYSIGTITLTAYKAHEIRVRSLIPGDFKWDWVLFTPR